MAAAIPLSTRVVEVGGFALALSLKALWDRTASRKRNDSLADSIGARLGEKLDAVTQEVRDVRHFVVGPDGKNGLRGELREFKQEVRDRFDAIEKRERDRLERAVGSYDRRSAP